MIIFTSSLTKWPGSFSLPGYDDFDGEMWDAYREIMDSGMADDTINRRFCYAGLALIDKFGTWEMETIALSEMQTWAKDKKAEKMRLVSWVGSSMGRYIGEIADPKGSL